MRTSLKLIVPFALALAGCAAQPEAPTVDCSKVTVPTYSQLTIWSTCTSCHSSAVTGSARKNAPGNIDFDTYTAAAAQASRAAGEVNAGTMPPAGSAQPSDAEKTALYAWAQCGAPN